MRHQFVILGDSACWPREAIRTALSAHYPEYEAHSRMRTRISVLASSINEIHDFIFDYQELMDNSYWRIVDLSGAKPQIELHRPQYEGRRKDFVDVEWEFIIGHLSNPLLQEKLRRWCADRERHVSITVRYDDAQQAESIAEKLRRRLPDSAGIAVSDNEADAARMDEFTQMAKYLNYVYDVTYRLKHIPTELPEDEVEAAWAAVTDERMKMSSIYNVMSIPAKMEILGYGRSDWSAYYALTAEEIDRLTAVEHNRWCVDRLIQGMRPCSDSERAEIEKDMQLRISDPDYAAAHPISLKKRFKTERNAHFDLCAFSELGLDESGLPVTRYDRDLIAAIPLIVKTYYDRHGSK